MVNPSSPDAWPSWKMSTSSAAPTATVSRFIASATSGRISEPVIMNRKPAVMRARIVTASGACELIAAF